jgi:putative membrane protein
VQQALRPACWLLFFVTLYLVFRDTIEPWLVLPNLGNVGFTLVMCGFVVLHCLLQEGPARTAGFFAISAIIAYLMEEIGVRTGLIYGAYHYSDLLGPKLGHVPIIIPLAWFMMIYPAWTVAHALLSGVDTHALPGRTAQALIAAGVVTGWDMVMDPGMTAAGNWIWEQGGAYFGVPLQNYFGWLLTTFLIYWFAGWLRGDAPRRTLAAKLFDLLPILIYAAIAVRYVFYIQIPALQVIALFSMGMPSGIAIVRVSLRKTSPKPA